MFSRGVSLELGGPGDFLPPFSLRLGLLSCLSRGLSTSSSLSFHAFFLHSSLTQEVTAKEEDTSCS